ncbi:MAG TPA: peptide ABC transporter substrate-binding protein [Gemmatimonadaceae bacterium]|jgi:peptide/nickel transport system substrate-binding protein
MVISVPADAATIFPPYTFEQVGRALQDQLYDRLADIGDDLNTIGDKGFTPHLADKWDWSRDSLSVAFHINPRARWHDGQPVRANDVRFSYGIFTDPKVGANVSSEISTVDSVSVHDSLTAVVWFKQRRPEAFYDFVYQIYILPEHLLKDIPPDQLRTSDITRKGIGSGRFRLARWDAGRRLEIVADTGNYFGRAKLDRVVWSIVPDASAALAQLLGGQADYLEIVPADQVHLVDSSKADRTLSYGNVQYAFLGFNLVDPKNSARPHPIFGDRQVRRALSMALDRKAMLQNVFGSLGRLSHGPFPRSISFADTTLPLLPYDVNAAKALLDSAGWREPSAGAVRQKNGVPLRFSLTLPVSSRPRVAYSVLIQEQLRHVGAEVDLDQLQMNVVGKKMLDRSFDAMLIGESTDPSPSGYKQQWGSSGVPPAGQNYTGYSNPTYDALLDSAVATFDISKQRALMRRAFQLQIDDAPGIWLYDPTTIAGLQKRIHPTVLRADSWSAHLADWTIPPNERIDRDRVGLGTRTP